MGSTVTRRGFRDISGVTCGSRCGARGRDFKDLACEDMPFQPGNQEAKKGNKPKLYRDALLVEAALAESGEDTPAKPGSLRFIARQLLNRAGDETAAAKEVGDRVDGKPAQAIIGGDSDDPPVRIEKCERVIIDPKAPDSDSEGLPPAAPASPV